MARDLVLMTLGILTCAAAEAQSYNCTGSGKLVCLVPFITSVTTTTSVGAAATAVQVPTSGFNGPIAAQLSQLPLAASAPGVSFLTVNGNPEAFENLGPILLDRPDSVGKHHLVLGFSFQQFHFNQIDGIGIHSIPFAYGYSQPQGSADPYQYASQTDSVSLKFNQYVMLATYGLAKNTDVSVIVPYGRVSISASTPSVTYYNISTSNTIDSTSTQNVPKFTPGVASGVGDVAINVKRTLWNGGESGRGSLATGFALRLPTGDALNYLGSGAYGYNLYALAAYKWAISPHVKFAYQWNSTTVLLNGITGVSGTLPGGAQFGAGADAKLGHRVTVSGDILANGFTNSPYYSAGSLTIPTTTASTISQNSTSSPGTTTCTAATGPNQAYSSCTLPAITVGTRTYTSANASLGVKIKPFGPRSGLTIFGNALVQINDVGLRSYPSPSFGISYNINPKK